MSDRCEIELSKRSLKQLKSYPDAASTIANALAELANDPERGHPLAGSLAGFRSLEVNVKGSGAFRDAYVFHEDAKVCVVFAIGPHEGFYERLKRQVGE